MQHILITGASSGLGAALALGFASPSTRLLLTGRDIKRLSQVAASCETRGATVIAAPIDVRDKEAMAAFVTSYPIDIAIANAGISAGTAGGPESPEQTEAIFATNVQGVLNTLEPLIPHMQKRRRGQLVIISSIASFKGFPGAPAYCASKAAIRFIGEAWRPLLRPLGIRVNVVCPGFIRTRMTDGNKFPMPLMMSPEEAASIIMRGLRRNQARIAFPWQLHIASWFLGILPPTFVDWFISVIPAKL